MNMMKSESKKNLIEGFVKRMDDNAIIEKEEYSNEDPQLFGVKPITFDLQFTSQAFVEKAGKKYLFKAGELIGEQMQLYQEKERVLPVENEFSRSYYRTITINIPYQSN